jgi:hypothetical protein
MEGQTRERWLDLCRQATVEQDPDKLLALVQEINDILEAKEARLKNRKPPPGAGSGPRVV